MKDVEIYKEVLHLVGKVDALETKLVKRLDELDRLSRQIHHDAKTLAEQMRRAK